MRSWITGVGLVLIYLGSAFALIAALGLVRLPDAYARFHAATKALTAGVISMAVGGALYMGQWVYTIRFGLIALLFLFSNPIGTHAIARAVHRMGLTPEDEQINFEEADSQ